MATGTELFFVKQAIDLIKMLGGRLAELRKTRAKEISRIERTFGNLDYLVPYYVIPDAQNVNPADFEEDDTGLIAKNNVFDMLDSFLAGPPRYSHAFILSDAGMGKTSLLVMLELFYLNKFIPPDFSVYLCKLGPDTYEEIDNLESPQHTVLLLDALDEDQEAWNSFYNRLQLILQLTTNFRKVIITCRTQFFPMEHEDDGRLPGMVVLSGFHCSKIFLSPFTDNQVSEYLEKRFDEKAKREKAKLIVNQMQSLRFRPMLLSYVDLLLEKEVTNFDDAYSVYDTLVDEWLNREMRKGTISKKKPVLEACTKIANYMYKRKKRAIEFDEVRDRYLDLADFKNLEYMTVEGRSLLNRDSEGNFKFAHYSILEYFVARTLAHTPNMEKNSDQVLRFIEDMLRNHGKKKASGLNLSKIRLARSSLPHADFSHSIISRGSFARSNLNRSNFSSTTAEHADFSYCKLTRAQFADSNCAKAIFRNSDLKAANISNCDLGNSDMKGVDLSAANMNGSIFSDAVLESSRINSVELEDASFMNCLMDNASFAGDSNLRNVVFSNASLNKSDFDHATIIGVNFRDSSLVGAKFVGTIIRKTDFEGSRIVSADFSEAKIDDVVFDGAVADESVFHDIAASPVSFRTARLRNSNFIGSDIANGDFSGATIDGAQFANARFKDCNLSKVTGVEIDAEEINLDECNLCNSHLAEIHLARSTITRSRFGNSILEKSDFTEAVLRDSRFAQCKLTLANFSNANLRSVDFTGANLSMAIFTGADLKGVNFTDAILEGADFTGAAFGNVNFEMARFSSTTIWPEGRKPKGFIMLGPGVVLRGAEFRNENLESADFSGAVLAGGDFSGCDLSKANFDGADLERCDFTSANLSGASFDNANLRKCKLIGTRMNGALLATALVDDATYNLETKFPDKSSDIKRRMRSVKG